MGIGELNDQQLGLILGSNKVNIEGFDTFKGRELDTEYGTAFFWVGIKKNVIILPRHGKHSNIPPHMINHCANMRGFQMLGVGRILSFTSVGSLNLDLKPGELVMPDDYINLNQVFSFHDNEIQHIIPSLDGDLREQIFNKIKGLPMNIKFNGIYIQTRGPRLETKAEIQMLKNFGDVIGMTMASEATLTKELNLKYANISAIDNYCNGLIEESLSMEVITDNQAKNSENITKIIEEIAI